MKGVLADINIRGFAAGLTRSTAGWCIPFASMLRVVPRAANRPWIAFDLAWGAARMQNALMTIQGRVHNGVVVLEGAPSLPEGAQVSVLYPCVRIRRKPGKKKRVKFPLVDSKRPGTVHLTGERIAEILEDEDVARYRKYMRQRNT